MKRLAALFAAAAMVAAAASALTGAAPPPRTAAFAGGTINNAVTINGPANYNPALTVNVPFEDQSAGVSFVGPQNGGLGWSPHAGLYVSGGIGASMLFEVDDEHFNPILLIHPDGTITLPSLPTADPHAQGDLWNDGSYVRVSNG